MTDDLIERLVAIGDCFDLSGLDLMFAVNFERDAPEDATDQARAAIRAEYGYISESIVDEIIGAMDQSDLFND